MRNEEGVVEVGWWRIPILDDCGIPNFFCFLQVPKFHYRLAENTFVAEACHCHLGHCEKKL